MRFEKREREEKEERESGVWRFRWSENWTVSDFLVNLLFKIEIVKLIDVFYGLDFVSFVVATNAASAIASAADAVKLLDLSDV